MIQHASTIFVHFDVFWLVKAPNNTITGQPYPVSECSGIRSRFQISKHLSIHVNSFLPSISICPVDRTSCLPARFCKVMWWESTMVAVVCWSFLRMPMPIQHRRIATRPRISGVFFGFVIPSSKFHGKTPLLFFASKTGDFLNDLARMHCQICPVSLPSAGESQQPASQPVFPWDLHGLHVDMRHNPLWPYWMWPPGLQPRYELKCAWCAPFSGIPHANQAPMCVCVCVLWFLIILGNDVVVFGLVLMDPGSKVQSPGVDWLSCWCVGSGSEAESSYVELSRIKLSWQAHPVKLHSKHSESTENLPDAGDANLTFSALLAEHREGCSKLYPEAVS